MFCTRRGCALVWCKLVVIVIFLAGGSQATAANSITLAWNANPESDIAGYKVYSGTNSHVYPAVVDVGKQTTVTLSNLTALESDFSPEIAYDVPVETPDLAFTYLGGGRYRIRFNGTPGAIYGIEYTESLGAPVWRSLGTRTAGSNGLVELIIRRAPTRRKGSTERCLHPR